MSEPSGQSERDTTEEPIHKHIESGILQQPSRRRLLQILCSGGLMGTAGCSALGDTLNTGTDTTVTETREEGGRPTRQKTTEPEGELQTNATIGIRSNVFNVPDLNEYNAILGYYTRALEPLIWVTKDMQVVPWLAQDWIRTGERTWRFELRKNVSFQNGDLVTADRVAAALDERVTDHLFMAHFLNIRPGQVQPVDDTTIELTTVFPTSNQPGYLSHMLGAIHHPDYSILKEENDPADVVGTGPYEIDAVKVNQHGKLSAFDDYWGGVPETDGPHINELRIRVLTDDNTRRLALRAGRIDIGMELPASQMGAITQSGDTKVATVPYAGTASLYFNLRDEPTSDIAFRKAVNYAVSQRKVVEGSQNGLGIPAKGPVPPVNRQSAHDSLTSYGPDKAKAQALVEESTYDGETITFLAREGLPPSADLVGQIVRQELKEIGVNMEVRIVGSGGEWRDRRAAGDGHLFAATKMQTTGTVFSMINAWMDESIIPRGNPPDTISNFRHTQPDARDRLNAVIRHVAKSAGNRRKRLLVEAQRILMEDVVVIVPLFHPEFLMGMHTGVEASDWHPIPRMSRLENLKLYK